MEKNLIYNKLVSNDNDFQGLVAYGLYKRHKIEFINQLKKETNKEYISDDDLKDFHISSNMPSQLNSYMLQAERLLSDTFVSVMSEQVEEEKKAIRKDLKKEIKSALPGWGRTIVISIISTIVASIVASVVLMFVSFKINFDDKVEQIQNSEKHIEQMISSLEKSED